MAETIMKETTEEQKNNTTENVVTPFEKNTGNENATKETEEKTSAAENSDSVKTDSMKNDSVNANSANADSTNAGTTNADTTNADTANADTTNANTINADTINADTTGSAHYRTIDDPSDNFSRDQWILSHIKDEDLMEYLRLEQHRMELLQQAKEKREKRIFTLVQLLLSLAAVIAVTYLLKDNPTILLSILYIVGIIGAFWIMKNPKDKSDRKNKDTK
ncbi:hypothetical protein DWY31_10350 [Dorea sp. AF24-7LB]|uniref:hypothetical protein n=1 Tax=Dorea sp. AF24-7LB TaxID=2293097 RepID=UPI000E4D7265|nr:hypothetical protein [Dorea sp. AF24-7LB]RHQ54425.1 hypothetical protein DWY31_10350 [Dorea sp. AF24-7LB]